MYSRRSVGVGSVSRCALRSAPAQEGSSRPGQYHNSRREIRSDPGQLGFEHLVHPEADRIQPMRAVEAKDCNLTLRLHLERLVMGSLYWLPWRALLCRTMWWLARP